MDASQVINSLKGLEVNVASVVAMGVLCYFFIVSMRSVMQNVLAMFDKHSEALAEVQGNMRANTEIIRTVSQSIVEMNKNVQENTAATHRMNEYFKNLPK